MSHSTSSIWLPRFAVLALVGGLAVPASWGTLSAQAPPLASATPRTVPDLDGLQRLFRDPPDDCRIMMRWWWFGPSVARTELEREMRAMKEGGIGGFEVQPVYPMALDDPERGIRNLPFLSDEFIDMLRFASDLAADLGLRMDLTLGSGWPYGGPQVSVGQAAGRLRIERVKLAPGSSRVAVPALASGERLIGVFAVPWREGSPIPGRAREIAATADGVIRLPGDLDGAEEVLFVVSSRTGMMVKRPAVGAEGFVLDHYDGSAVSAYLKSVGDRLMPAFGPHPPHAIFCDSLEVYGSDWTAGFLEEFRARRGYDLRPHLPALVIDAGPETLALRHDWGQTLTELLDERFLEPVHEWARRHHALFRVQAYGIPPATISSSAHADLPEGEGAQWTMLSASRWASSASHVYDRPVTSSETWTWLHSPVFRATPLDMKAEADRHFLQGINQLIGHGWPYSPEGAEYPGWRLYAAGVFNDKNPWWIVMPDLAKYLQRTSFVLRQGQPVNDVAIYLPTSDAWAHFEPGRVGSMIDALARRLGPDVVSRVLESGHNLDLFDDGALRTGRVEADALVLGTGRYRAVVLPGVERMPLETLRTIETFARGGGVLIATRRLPERAPGFLATDADQRAVRDLAERLFRAPGAPGRYVENESAQLAGTLTDMLGPDVQITPAAPDIGFVHRRAASSDIYFLANTSNRRQQADASFRVESRSAGWWNPITGTVSAATVLAGPGRRARVALDLEPYGSRVLVFQAPGPASAPAARRPPVTQVPRALRAPVPAAIDLTNGWTVTLGPSGVPAVLNRLRSWTEDEDTRFFSGVGTYEREVTVPASLLKQGLGVSLDFGEAKPLTPDPTSRVQAWLEAPVREAAVVYINGTRAGSVWCPPYALDVTRLLRTGENRIRILVANLAVNHMAGRALPDYRLLNLRYGTRFEPQDMDKVQAVPSGLLGPIRLVAGAPQ